MIKHQYLNLHVFHGNVLNAKSNSTQQIEIASPGSANCLKTQMKAESHLQQPVNFPAIVCAQVWEQNNKTANDVCVKPSSCTVEWVECLWSSDDAIWCLYPLIFIVRKSIHLHIRVLDLKERDSFPSCLPTIHWPWMIVHHLWRVRM